MRIKRKENHSCPRVGKTSLAVLISNLLCLGFAILLFLPSESKAKELQLHLTGAGAHALGKPQQNEFNFGGEGSLHLGISLGSILDCQIGATGLLLSQGDPPANPNFNAHKLGTLVSTTGGFRIYPFGAWYTAGLWLDANGGVGFTGNRTRPVVDTHLGYDWRLGNGRWVLGPFAGYTHIFETQELQPEDAHIVWAGLHIGLGHRTNPPPLPDRDHDGIPNHIDACPDTPGITTLNPKTNGCPDADRDGIPDHLDACPHTPGIPTDDPNTNGCPDTDHDGIPDPKDICPYTPGMPTNDPRTNGCPDTDEDGIPDYLDACPTIPGIQTDDPKTNGCPGADVIRVEGDRITLSNVILFDFDSPRVRHVSWPLVKKLADFLNSTPDIVELDIDGHADQIGTSEYNLRLSKTRAESVKSLLVRFGVDPGRLTTLGLGKLRPRKKGLSESERRVNRRVEFTITRARATNPNPTRSPSPSFSQ
ncbi:OmpA family protein [Pajaroellobacter abortibovis]|uniref:OmpA-like domain-containing protein n=1 Tax=Pajaroellobacter abortibovis TaxID=1882918 RepID=A0A1L6MYG1_9BACT|nr:OmpA family protein [Pajaroellobacter abortibovis]APS00613.1 hypothetical protein BCY86_07965 [Pajaroellobacter abortibovis]